jgi:hypothetical protein
MEKKVWELISCYKTVDSMLRKLSFYFLKRWKPYSFVETKIKNSAKVFGYTELQAGLSFVLRNLKWFCVM